MSRAGMQMYSYRAGNLMSIQGTLFSVLINTFIQASKEKILIASALGTAVIAKLCYVLKM